MTSELGKNCQDGEVELLVRPFVKETVGLVALPSHGDIYLDVFLDGIASSV